MDFKNYSTIIVITPKDFPRLTSQYDRLVANIPSEKIIFVSGSGIEDELIKAKLGDKVTFLDENKLITFAEVNECMAEHLKHILGNDPVPRAATGWYYQQFLKMQYAYECQDEYYMAWDGDTIPCKPFSMFQEETGAPYLDMKQEYHALYFETLEKLLPGMRKCVGKSFISEHMLFNTKIMKELIDKIEANDSIPGTKFWEKIIHAISPESICDSGFSEFETYGTFVAFTHTDLYKLREWHSFRLAGEFFNLETICDRDYEWLGKDFNAISFEKNQFVRDDNKNLFDNPEYQKKLSARKMLEIAQEEFNGGYIEVWGDYTGNQVYDPLLTKSNSSSDAKKENIPEDVYFDRLGDLKTKTNINQAFLCYENAEFLSNDAKRKAEYKKKKEELFNSGKVTVRKAAISIVSFNSKNYLEECIRSIRFHCAPDSYSIVIADNASKDGVRDYLKTLSGNVTVILNDENRGFPGGCNDCINNSAKDQDIFLLNNDTRMTHNALFYLRMGLYENDSIGAAGCLGSYAGNNQAIDMHYSKPEDYMNFAKSVNVYLENPLEEKSRLCGFAMIIKREVLDKVGLFDEAFAPGYCEDDDLSIRIHKAGYKMVLVHNSFIYHKGSASCLGDAELYKYLNSTMERNKDYLAQKYGCDLVVSAHIFDNEKGTLSHITHSIGDSFTFLEVNAGTGNFLSALKYAYPNAEVHGAVCNKAEQECFVTSIPVSLYDVNNCELQYEEGYFDYIVVKSGVTDKDNISPEKAKEDFEKYVKPGGKLLYIKIV